VGGAAAGSPNNRFVSYLTSVPMASQHDPQELAPEDAQRALEGAKKVLEAMPWFGLHEHVSDSLFLLDEQLGVRPDPLHWTSLLAAEDAGSHKDLGADVAALVERHNRLDMVGACHAQRVCGVWSVTDTMGGAFHLASGTIPARTQTANTAGARCTGRRGHRIAPTIQLRRGRL
jgi:hypothetical protein